MRKLIKKIFRYLVRILLILLLVVITALTVFYIYINTGAGRRQLGQQISKYAGKALGCEMSIAEAKWNFPSSVSLSHVVIKDHRKKDMFIFESLEAGLDYYNFLTGRITFSSVNMNHVKFDLERYPGDSNSNFGYVISRLSQGGDTSKPSTTDIMFNVVNINDLHFIWNDQTLPEMRHPGIDWNHLDVDKVNGRFTFLWVDGTTVSAKIKKLGMIEKSGFVLNDLRGIAKYTSKSIEINSMDLLTPYSEIGNTLKLEYDDPETMVDFVNTVDLTADFYNSRVSFRDLNYFTPDLKNKTDSVIINHLESSGKIRDLHIHDIDAGFGANSVVKAKVDIKGLPNIDETFIACKFQKTKTSREELQRLLPELDLPADLDKLGIVSAKGNFTGFINDFVTYADFETDLGNVSSDLNMKISKDLAQCTYSGKLSLNKFNIGTLTGEPTLGFMTMQGTLKGKGLTLESVKANLDAGISEMDFKKYTYHTIKINGEVASKFFKGFVNIQDKNLALDFKGTIDYTKPKPEFIFQADIPNANLYALNLAQDSLAVSTTVKINLRGIHPDDIDGEVIARDTRLNIPGKSFVLDSINVNTSTETNNRKIHIYSNLVMADISGNFKFSRLGDLIKTAANQYLDSEFLHIKVTPPTDQFVIFNIRFLDLTPVFSVFRINATASDTGFINGSIYANDNKLVLNGRFPSFTYNNMRFKDLVFSGLGNNNYLEIKTGLGSFEYNDSIYVRDADIKIRSNMDKLTFDIYGADQLHQKKAWLKGSFDVMGKQAWLDLDSSKLEILGNRWNLSANRITFYNDTMMDAPLITLTRGEQVIRVSGQYSAKNSYPIRIITENLSVQTLETFVPQIKGVSGKINGQVVINDINRNPIVEAAIYVETLVYLHDTLGTLSAATSYNEMNKKLTLDMKLENKEQQEVAKAFGNITMDYQQKLALNVFLNKTDIGIFEPLISDILSDLNGQATANIAITGNLNEPIVNGNIQFNNAEFKVNYTNVKYHFTHEVNLSGHIISIKNMDVYDVYNNVAKVNGHFNLGHLDNASMSLDINAKSIMGLNTTQKMNDLYFGKAFGTGKVTINGPFDNLKFVIKAKTEKNTTFYMPLSQGSTFYGHDYIKFINKGNYLRNTQDIKLSGIEISMDIEVTPDAYGEIIFDPRVGDIIEARGRGNLRLDVNSDGEFSMFGTYSITEGNYRFTAFDVINKSFKINPGSTISWNGNPYDAQLNVDAIYTIHTSLKPLQSSVYGSSSGNENDYLRIYPVDAKLNLKGSLMQPEIKLDFEIRELNTSSTASAEIENTVRQIRNNEQDLNQQVVSLLVLNQFAPVNQFGPNSNLGGTAILTTSVGDLVSNQVNYWLSKISEDIHVGIDYRQSEEATFRISQDILKQRVNLTASYDVQNNNYNTQLSYKIRPDGSLQMRIFGRSNNNPLQFQNSNTQGIGILYHREFDRISELFRKRSQKQKPD